MRKVCVITGTRAEYGILSTLMRMIQECEEMQLQILVTNMHLSPEFGLTYREIEADGFHIDKKVEILLSSDTSIGTLKSMGLASIGLADAFDDLRPDMVVILGDRYEMLVAAQCAMIMRIPIAHLFGGEITEGAYDDVIRHCITKLSNIHFTSTEEYRNRVIQLGEQPSRVHYVGSLGIDNILHEIPMTLEDLEKSLNFCLSERFFVVTFHPVTMEDGTAEEQCQNLLEALEYYMHQYKLLITLPNSDAGGRTIISKIKEFVSLHPEKAYAISSLGKKRYYSALKYCSVVVGNSSSGLVEAPSFHIPTLNIGNRQKGRVASQSVVHCGTSKDAIVAGLKECLSDKMKQNVKKYQNPYARENTAQLIFNEIRDVNLEEIKTKAFYNIICQ